MGLLLDACERSMKLYIAIKRSKPSSGKALLKDQLEPTVFHLIRIKQWRKHSSKKS